MHSFKGFWGRSLTLRQVVSRLVRGVRRDLCHVALFPLREAGVQGVLVDLRQLLQGDHAGEGLGEGERWQLWGLQGVRGLLGGRRRLGFERRSFSLTLSAGRLEGFRGTEGGGRRQDLGGLKSWLGGLDLHLLRLRLKLRLCWGGGRPPLILGFRRLPLVLWGSGRRRSLDLRGVALRCRHSHYRFGQNS